MSTVAPCPYVGCNDGYGNAVITSGGICEHCRNRYRRLLGVPDGPHDDHRQAGHLVWNWLVLRVTMPKPVSTGLRIVVSRGEKVHGHPAEWSSDLMRDIARQFGDTHAALAEHLGHNVAIPGPRAAEPARIRAAQQYIRGWFNELCGAGDNPYPWAAEDAAEFSRLNRNVLSGLGHTDRKAAVPGVPCPKCDMQTLCRAVSIEGEQTVECRHCGPLAPAEYTAWLEATAEKIFENLAEAA